MSIAGIELHEVEFVREYWHDVFESFVEDCAAGLTPKGFCPTSPGDLRAALMAPTTMTSPIPTTATATMATATATTAMMATASPTTRDDSCDDGRAL